jgi:hypothetical protein
VHVGSMCFFFECLFSMVVLLVSMNIFLKLECFQCNQVCSVEPKVSWYMVL